MKELINLGLLIWLAVWYFGDSTPTYTGDTRTQTYYDVDNCIDEVLDDKPWLERNEVKGC